MKKILALLVLVTITLSASTTKHHTIKTNSLTKLEQTTLVFRKDIGTAD